MRIAIFGIGVLALLAGLAAISSGVDDRNAGTLTAGGICFAIGAALCAVSLDAPTDGDTT